MIKHFLLAVQPGQTNEADTMHKIGAFIIHSELPFMVLRHHQVISIVFFAKTKQAHFIR